MIALIDGDIVAYRSSASVEKIPTLAELAAMDKSPDDREGLIEILPLGIALARLDDTIEKMLNHLNTDDYQVYLSGGNNFREVINPEYKANRKHLRRPHWLEQCKEHLVVKWGAIVADGIEADDCLAIHQTDDTIICSIDKDLLQVVGKHFNFVTGVLTEIDFVTGQRNLYKQMLEGDTTDNIIGVNGIGKKRAAKLLDPITEPEEMHNLVYSLYDDDERFNMNLQCLSMLKEYPYEYPND